MFAAAASGRGRFASGVVGQSVVIAGQGQNGLLMTAVLANAGGVVNNGAIRQQGAVALTIDPGAPNVDGNGANFVNNNILQSEGTGGADPDSRSARQVLDLNQAFQKIPDSRVRRQVVQLVKTLGRT